MSPDPEKRLRAGARAALAVSVGVAAVLLLWPSGAQVRRLHIDVWSRLWRMLGRPGWFTPEVLEQVANTVVMIVPMAAVTVLVRRVPRWLLFVGGAMVGVVVELVQWAFLPARLPDAVDAVFNALGAVIGVALGLALRRKFAGTGVG